MDRLVHYHHPLAENLSLGYSSDSLDEIRNQQQASEGETKLMGYPFEAPVYVLYEGERDVEVASELDLDDAWLMERIEPLPRLGQVVAFRLVELLEAAVDAREGDEFRLYKSFEPEKINQALANVSWGTPLPQVAGEVMSNLILRHSLPNANHRTAIAMMQFCIESVDPAFEMPRTHVDDEAWKAWVDPYIVESKRLITVRRNNIRFKRLSELGVDLVERKDGIQIRLETFDLDMHAHEALRTFAQRHEAHCTEFVQSLLAEAGREDLQSVLGPTEQEFADYLESGLVDRDFGELF